MAQHLAVHESVLVARIALALQLVTTETEYRLQILGECQAETKRKTIAAFNREFWIRETQAWGPPGACSCSTAAPSASGPLRLRPPNLELSNMLMVPSLNRIKIGVATANRLAQHIYDDR